ncbi:protein neprosin [Quercus suber]|uniref:protein neprosin n=1 Tax=Quercus suber TaxID=58331 RepID=UPI0032DEFF72
MDFEKTILIVVLYLFLASSYRVSGARILTHEEDSLLEIQLKLINKPPVKSIQTEYGHIVDCIDINKQLAFDHPLLKHHKIQVSPDIYHDGSPHFFAVFTNDNFEQAGCLNNMCPGFVQTHKSVYLGATITNVSVPSGPQFQTTISLQRDSNYNWWISIEGFVVGYYPKEIVFNLNQPQGIGWGGVAVGRPNGNSAPPMGSGEFSDGSNACEFSNIQYRNEENTTLAPQSPHYKIITDNPKCYDLKYDGYKNPEVGFTFKFGGPGGPCSN